MYTQFPCVWQSKWQSKKQGPPRSGEGRTLLCFLAGDLVDSGNQPEQSALHFLVGKALDALLLGDDHLLAAGYVALGSIAQGVLQQEFRALGAALGLEQALGNVGLDALEGIVDDAPVFFELHTVIVEVHNDPGSEPQKEAQTRYGVMLAFGIAAFKVLVHALAQKGSAGEAVFQRPRDEVLAGQ